MTLYLDHAATTTIRPEARAAFEDAYDRFDANASGQHAQARRAKNALEDARERASEMLGTASPHDIVFTGSGTESDNLAVVGASLASESTRIAVSAIEHKAVLLAASSLVRFGYSVDTIPASPRGVIEPEAAHEAGTDRPGVVSVMLANNEIG
ncbi:MAG: aminotransferase class V-fold PLP-dependent enzyme, partial [Actinomycetota bacterium]